MAAIAAHKLTNLLHCVFLLGAMALLLAALGWSLWGGLGLVWVALIGALWLALAPRASPRMILRLYRARSLSPEEAPGLHRMLVRLADKARLSSIPRVYYVPSRVINAFSLGRREEAAIALSDGLLRCLSERELIGVLAHELSHIRNNDLLAASGHTRPRGSVPRGTRPGAWR